MWWVFPHGQINDNVYVMLTIVTVLLTSRSIPDCINTQIYHHNSALAGSSCFYPDMYDRSFAGDALLDFNASPVVDLQCPFHHERSRADRFLVRVIVVRLALSLTLPVLWKKLLNKSSSFHICLTSRLNCRSTVFRSPTSMIMFKLLPADCADGIGYVSRTLIFDGVCNAVLDPIVPPPPTTMTVVLISEATMVQTYLYGLLGIFLFHVGDISLLTIARS